MNQVYTFYLILFFLLPLFNCYLTPKLKSSGPTKTKGKEIRRHSYYAYVYEAQRVDSPTLICGGSLVHKNIVLTASICIESQLKLIIRTVYGSHRLVEGRVVLSDTGLVMLLFSEPIKRAKVAIFAPQGEPLKSQLSLFGDEIDEDGYRSKRYSTKIVYPLSHEKCEEAANAFYYGVNDEEQTKYDPDYHFCATGKRPLDDENEEIMDDRQVTYDVGAPLVHFIKKKRENSNKVIIKPAIFGIAGVLASEVTERKDVPVFAYSISAIATFLDFCGDLVVENFDSFLNLTQIIREDDRV